MASVVERPTFSIPDYVILALTLAMSIVIGLYYGFHKGGQRTTKQFLMGDRKMPFWPTVMSLLVSFQSGILILGFSSELYMKGITYAWALVGILVGLPIAALTYVPVLYNMKLTSAFELTVGFQYLELRFNSKLIRHIGGVLWMLGTLMYLAIVLYAPSTAMAAVSTLSLESLIAITAAVCTFYTMTGGLKAVVWTDALQGLIMFGGLLAIMIQGFIVTGGPKKAFEIATQQGRLETVTSPDPLVYMNVWVVVFGTFVGWMSIYGTDQGSVQRYCSLPTVRQAQWSVILTAPAIVLVQPLVIVCGMIMFAYYHQCDPIILKHVDNRDQLLPHFVLDVLGGFKGLPGLFLAVLYSGTLSTVSTGINSLSAVVWEDFIKRYHKRPIDEVTATRITKGLVLLFGAVATGFAFACQHMGGVFQASLTVLSSLGAPKTGLFMLGIFFPWVTWQGGLAGVVSACAVMGWICIGAQVNKPFRQSLPRSISGCSNETLSSFLFNATVIPEAADQLSGIDNIYKISYKLYSVIGILLVLVVGAAVSLCTRQSMEVSAEERRMIFQPFTRILPPLKCEKVKPTSRDNEMKDVNGVTNKF